MIYLIGEFDRHCLYKLVQWQDGSYQVYCDQEIGDFWDATKALEWLTELAYQDAVVAEFRGE
jgi:hypothetical protein